MARHAVRHQGQGVLTRVLPHQGNARFIPRNPPPVGALFASYAYTTGAAPPQNPGLGAMNQATASLIVRLNETDANGRNLGAGLSQLMAGDLVTIGPQTGTLADKPFKSGASTWTFAFVAFPVLANATYVCTAKKAGT